MRTYGVVDVLEGILGSTEKSGKSFMQQDKEMEKLCHHAVTWRTEEEEEETADPATWMLPKFTKVL